MLNCIQKLSWKGVGILTEAEKRQHRCCFTGHRPEKLQSSEEVIQKELEQAIRQAIADGFTVFLSGMARGVDLWAAEIVLSLRDVGLPIKLICVCPYYGMEQSWERHWQKKYRTVLQRADLIRFLYSDYRSSCFQIRNQWMVDHSARVIAVFHGSKGGTKNTIDYARKLGVPVIFLQDKSK